MKETKNVGSPSRNKNTRYKGFLNILSRIFVIFFFISYPPKMKLKGYPCPSKKIFFRSAPLFTRLIEKFKPSFICGILMSGCFACRQPAVKATLFCHMLIFVPDRYKLERPPLFFRQPRRLPPKQSIEKYTAERRNPLYLVY